MRVVSSDAEENGRKGPIVDYLRKDRRLKRWCLRCDRWVVLCKGCGFDAVADVDFGVKVGYMALYRAGAERQLGGNLAGVVMPCAMSRRTSTSRALSLAG